MDFTDLPIEVIIETFTYLSKDKILSLFSPQLILNSQINFTFCKLLIHDNIYIGNIKDYGTREFSRNKLVLNTCKLIKFNRIFNTSYSLNYNFQPRSVNIIFTIVNKSSIVELKKIFGILFKCFKVPLCFYKFIIYNQKQDLNLSFIESDCSIQLFANSLNDSNLASPNIYQLTLFNNFRHSLAINKLPCNLKKLIINGKDSSTIIILSLKDLPRNLQELYIGEFIQLMNPRRLHNLNVIISNNKCFRNNLILFKFMLLNRISIVNLELTYFSLIIDYLKLFKNLNHLTLNNCLRFPYSQLHCLEQLNSLTIIDNKFKYDENLINSIRLPPFIKNFEIYPIDRFNCLKSLIFPISLNTIRFSLNYDDDLLFNGDEWQKI